MTSVGRDDPNVKYLTSYLLGALKDLDAPPISINPKSKTGNKNAKQDAPTTTKTDSMTLPLTRGQYFDVQSKMLQEIVGLMKGLEDNRNTKIASLTAENERLR